MHQDTINELFNQLLIRTCQDPNHGARPNYQEDDHGMLWEYTATMDRAQALDVLNALSKKGMLPDLHLPQEGNFFLLGVKDDVLHALYSSTFHQNYYLLQTSGIRYYQWLLRKYSGKEATASQGLAYLALQQIYGFTRSSLPLSRMVA